MCRYSRNASAGITDGRLVQRVEGALEAAGLRLFGLRQGLEPIGDLIEALLAGGARHARIHVGVFVRLAGDRGLQVVAGAADRLSGRRVADFLEKFEVAMRVAGLAFGGRAKYSGDIVIAFDVGLLREIQITTVGLALAGE